MRLLFQIHDEEIRWKIFKSWDELRDFFTQMINNEIVYEWDGDIDCLKGNLIDFKLDEDLFELAYNQQELIIQKEKLKTNKELIPQLERIFNCMWQNTSVFINIMAILE